MMLTCVFFFTMKLTTMTYVCKCPTYRPIIKVVSLHMVINAIKWPIRWVGFSSPIAPIALQDLFHGVTIKKDAQGASQSQSRTHSKHSACDAHGSGNLGWGEIHVANIVYIIDVDLSNVFWHLSQQAHASFTGRDENKNNKKQRHEYWLFHKNKETKKLSCLHTMETLQMQTLSPTRRIYNQKLIIQDETESVLPSL